MANTFDIPESASIDEMLDDLMTAPAVPASSASVILRRLPSTRNVRKSRFRRFGSWTLCQFTEGMNWKNVTSFRSSLTTDSARGRSRLGAVTLAVYGDSFNWRNALDGPQLVLATGPASADSGPPETVSDFFDAMSFE